MRIYEMLTLGKMLWFFKKFSQLIFREIYGGKSGELVSWYWGLKCLKKSLIYLFAHKIGVRGEARDQSKTKNQTKQKAHTKRAS